MSKITDCIIKTVEGVALALPFALGATLLSWIGTQWELVIRSHAFGKELPEPARLYNDFLNEPLIPYFSVVLFAMLPTTYRVKAALFAGYFLMALLCMALPFLYLANIVDGPPKPRDYLVWMIACGAMLISALRVAWWLRKRRNSSS